MKRVYTVWLNYYNEDEVYEEWATKGNFETILEAAHEVLEVQEDLKDIVFWNDDVGKPFAQVNRCDWERYKSIPEYYYVEEN